MAVIDTAWGSTHLMRNEVFSSQVKEIFRDETYARQWVNMTNELPDGMNLKINSIGELTMDEAAESTSLPTRRMDTGQFIFNIDEFQGVKVAFTDEFFEDDFMAPSVLAATPREMMRAFDVEFETKVLAIANKTGGQAKNVGNIINDRRHRFVASGTSRALTLADFAYAKQALKKAKVPMVNLIAIVDPSVEFSLDITSNIVDISSNPMWQGLVETGIGTGTRFIRNIYGFDVYTSDYLDEYVSGESALANYSGTTVAPVAGDKMAIFFANAGGDASPFLGAFRREPSIKSWRDEAIGTEYHQMSVRYGLGLYRPENLVTVWHSDTLSA